MGWQRLRGAIWLAVLACLLSVVAAAQGGGVDLARSRIYVFVGKTGGGHEHAMEGMLSKGELDLSRQENAGSLTFDLKSISADTPAARKVWRLGGDIDAGTRWAGDDDHAGRRGARHGPLSDRRIPGAKGASFGGRSEGARRSLSTRWRVDVARHQAAGAAECHGGVRSRD